MTPLRAAPETRYAEPDPLRRTNDEPLPAAAADDPVAELPPAQEEEEEEEEAEPPGSEAALRESELPPADIERNASAA